jgi:hypothetical protein
VDKLLRVIFYGLVLVLSQSCTKPQLNTFNEVVMCKGMRIVAERQGETLEISAQDDVVRSYATGGVDVSFKLKPRDARWYGSLGLYRASGNRDVHAVLEEGHQYFASAQEALEWLKWQDDRLHYVYNSSGLVVGWSLQRNPSESDPRHALSVQVWQFYINGKKPASLANANDDALRISYQKDRCERAAASHYLASRPQQLVGREYSGKAVDILKERAIDPQQVEQAIREGERYEQNGLKGYLYDLPGGGLLWVLLDSSGRVVLLG